MCDAALLAPLVGTRRVWNEILVTQDCILRAACAWPWMVWRARAGPFLAHRIAGIEVAAHALAVSSSASARAAAAPAEGRGPHAHCCARGTPCRGPFRVRFD